MRHRSRSRATFDTGCAARSVVGRELHKPWWTPHARRLGAHADGLTALFRAISASLGACLAAAEHLIGIEALNHSRFRAELGGNPVQAAATRRSESRLRNSACEEAFFLLAEFFISQESGVAEVAEFD